MIVLYHNDATKPWNKPSRPNIKKYKQKLQFHNELGFTPQY